MFSGLSRRAAARRCARLPIRVRLATSVAVVAFLILAGVRRRRRQIVMAHRLRSAFIRQVNRHAEQSPHPCSLNVGSAAIVAEYRGVQRRYGANVAAPRCRADLAPRQDRDLGKRLAPPRRIADWSADHFDGYRVVTIPVNFVAARASGYLQYGPAAGIGRQRDPDLELMLFLGVLVGTVLAFGAGLARRAPRDRADRRADRGRERDRAHPRPEPHAARAGRRRRGRGALAHAQRACSRR